VWQIPETDVRALPDVRGKDLLEFGCGTCQWSIALAGTGARPVGLDFSDQQLPPARHLMDAVTTYRSQRETGRGAGRWTTSGRCKGSEPGVVRAGLLTVPRLAVPAICLDRISHSLDYISRAVLQRKGGSWAGSLVPPPEAALADVSRSRCRYGRVLVDQF
jgi:hypothetical protein